MNAARDLVAGMAVLTLAGAPVEAAQPPAVGSPPPSQAPGAPSTLAAPELAGPAAPPTEPSASAASFAPRSGIQCADFRPVPGASWLALASISFPGPQGLVRISAGQTVSPGAYVSGLDLAAVLQARCF